MECPKCGNTNLRIFHSVYIGGGKLRYRRCVQSDDGSGCGLVFRTHEEITTVEVFNHNTLRTEIIDVKDYKSKHVTKELKGKSGFEQSRMFED